jgi:hypothetical protein
MARRVQELDAVASILPMARRDRLAELLTEADIATLKHLLQQGRGNRCGRWPRSSAISMHVFARVPRVAKDFLAAHLVGSGPILVLGVPSS